MKKLIIMVLLAALYAFGSSCTTTSIEEESAEYGTNKSESVNTEGSSDELEYDNSED